MVDTTIPYQIVIFTAEYSISGGVFLRDQRLSDFLNDKRETTVMLRNSNVARLDNPAKILEKAAISFVPKAGIVIVFEPPQPVQATTPRFIKYPKEKYEVFMILDGMEAQGEIHMQRSLDLHQVMAEPTVSFLPITQASVTIKASPNFQLKQDTVMVNLSRIRFIGEVQPKSPTQPRP